MNHLIDKVVSYQSFYYLVKNSHQIDSDMYELDCFIIGSERPSSEPTHIMIGSPKKLHCNQDIVTVDISLLNKDSKFYYELFKE